MRETSSQNLSKDITSTFVRRLYSIGNQKSRRAKVVSHHSQRGGATFAFFEFFFAREIDAAEFSGAFHQRHKQIGVVVGDDALEDGGDAFEAHTSVDQVLP